MKTTAAAVRVLALAVLLGGARAGAGGARAACRDQRAPKITIDTPRKHPSYNHYMVSYGQDIVLHCSSNDITNLIMKESGKPLKRNVINKTTIQFCVNKPNIGDFKYSCVDSEAGCKDSVGVTVLPAMSVEASRVHYKLDQARHLYFAPLGEDYVVFCRGTDSGNLRIEDYDSKKQQSEVVNDTTIKYRTRAKRVEDKYYYCNSKGTEFGEDGTTLEKINVKVDYYPEAYEFQCFIHQKRVLECSWVYHTDKITFQLFYIDHDENMKLICVEGPGKEMTNICKWDIRLTGEKSFYRNQNMSLLLTSCNNMFCDSQTFVTNTDLITKLNPITRLSVLNTDSRGAVLRWNSPRLPFAHESDLEPVVCKTCVYKIQYRLTPHGEKWRYVNAAVQCDEDGKCEFPLTLTYPDVEYEVRVYARHEKATDNRSWSDPESIVVHTEPREPCACDAAQAETPISADTASCEACTLIGDTIDRYLDLKNKIKSSLKYKRAKIKRKVMLLSSAKELARELNSD